LILSRKGEPVGRAAKARRTAAVLIIAIVASGISIVATGAPAQALSGSDFNPGNIISDANFHNSASMTDDQIQAFLASKEPTCAAGYTCLKNYTEDTSQGEAAAPGKCAAYVGAPAELASTIIGKVSRACNINPQVILATMQKEEGLVTATAPTAAAIRAAMGYNCPDSSPICNPASAGFFDQIYGAAWQFETYEVSPNFTRYHPGATHQILYNPNAGCGTESVYVYNQATADLYYYTPYTPNTAALANLTGQGDGCSSYGNRNFWVYFSEWFGTPNGPEITNGSFDSAIALPGQIEVTGWSVDPFASPITSPTYVWINVDGAGGPAYADLPLNWIQAAYPDSGPDHGFDSIINASTGTHQVCVYGDNSIPLGCKSVTVPTPSRGSFDSAVGVPGGVLVSGWAVDSVSPASVYVWINVDGNGGPVSADAPLNWIPAMFPTLGTAHGVSATVSASPGPHTVCMYGYDSINLGCKSVMVPSSAAGSFDSASGVLGGIQISGWTLDTTSANSQYGWASVDGTGGPVAANAPLNWINSLYPGVGPNHGINATLSAGPGHHTVCLYGFQSINLGCKSVTVPSSAAGSFDTATAVSGGVVVTGWTLDTTSSDSEYAWINVDGVGGPVLANAPLNWINALYPGVGPNHGLSATVNVARGTHTICVYGYQSINLGCKTVTVN